MLTACLLLFFAMVLACLLAGWSVTWALASGLGLFWLFGLRRGFTHRQLWAMAWAKCRKSLVVVEIILLIGAITGLWRAGGTIAYCIVQGVELVTPHLFLVVAFLLCAVLSYVLGTSYGVCSTMGVILMALARSGGVDPVVTAGVVLSGVYFGDRCSPASSAAALVAAVTETDLYRNIRMMLRTGLLPTLVTLGIYAVLSFRHPIAAVDSSVLSALSGRFSIAWPALLPALVMFLLPLFRIPIKLAMGASIAVSAALAVGLQGFSLGEVLSIACLGYQPAEPALAAVLSGGGVVSMASSCIVVIITGLFSGILEGSGGLAPLGRSAETLAEKIGRFPAMNVVSVLSCAVLCNQAVTSMLCQQLMQGSYSDQEELAMDIENSGIMRCGLIPWSIACSVPLEMLGVGNSAIPYGVLLWITPVCYLLTKSFFYPGRGPENRSRCKRS